ncbi:MAG: CDP-glycerol glycerophosphotransferase family protein, partial [Erysipelotrichaceae bacterium]|nr:CDP-glycerol glycerophosphotransferase family protein [Erysipelotrichaceae bacterium]
KKSILPNLIFLLIFYWLILPIYGNKEIWLMYDKLYKGGDNGEYFFRYCMDKNDGYQDYYILNKTAAGFESLSKDYGKNVVEFNSLKNKILTLHATRIFSTHANVYRYCGISKSFLPYVKDLLNSENYCLQHGLTIQKIAQYQNRLEDNLKLYFCSSKYEIENLRHPVYGFEDNQLLLTGSPRYDGLKNNDQKQILITPTWRRNIVITGNKFGTSKDYNDQFKNTVYFDIYDSLINDKKLIDTAKEQGYKIVYLLHPVMSSQINDFHIQDGVEIVAATSDMSYEKILTESSLMVTDYSGVQFDFAYQKKPILYYHPDRLPPQYDESCFKYDTMGFGPILESHTEIVDSLCEYMKNQCQMKEEYITRVDEFFAYSDFNNSERIYENVIELIKNK